MRPLLPESLPGLEISRTELKLGGQMTGVPHTTGTREYLTCERGQVELIADGEHFLLEAGVMLVFRGDQRHSYRNPSKRSVSVSISVVCFARSADFAGNSLRATAARSAGEAFAS